MSARRLPCRERTPWSHFGPEDDAFDTADLDSIATIPDLRRRFPRADVSIVPYLRDLLATAESYALETGRHLDIYGAIGTLFASVVYGVGTPGGRHVYQRSPRLAVCTLTPFEPEPEPAVELPLADLGTLVVVHVDQRGPNDTLHLSGRLIRRDALPAAEDGLLLLGWEGICVPAAAPRALRLN
jgi:hypothetical protein